MASLVPFGAVPAAGRGGGYVGSSRPGDLCGKARGLPCTMVPEVIAAVLNRVAEEIGSLLGMPAEAVIREGVKNLLASKIQENDRIVDGLKEKYGASGYLELEDKIGKGEVPEHRAWEDVILWEELSRCTQALRRLLCQLEAAEAAASSLGEARGR